jgi:hypothetical protein
MRKPNLIFLSVIALAALLPHTHLLLQDDPATARVEQPSPAEKTKAPTESSNPPVLSSATRPATEKQAGSNSADTKPLNVEDADPVVTPDNADEEEALIIAAPDENPLDALETVYSAESFDPSWATPIEETFYDVFNTAALLGSDVEQAECRKTLCRFSVAHQDADAQNAFIQAFLQSHLVSKQAFGTIAHHSETTTDGGIAAVYFLSRNEMNGLSH